MRDLGVSFDKSILYRTPILVGAYRAGTADSCYGTQNQHSNTQNNLVEGDIIREMTVETTVNLMASPVLTLSNLKLISSCV